MADSKKTPGSNSSLPEVADWVKSIAAGDRTLLATAITVVESNAPHHRSLSNELVNACLPLAGNSVRVGITGVPGVGKSTYIEALGQYLIAQGHRVAVLAIDPSSPVSGGSIMGDKTRMDKLAQSEKAFIRPSPSGGAHGGVARKTRETIVLCEAAGYDIILVETVGVGQGETTVHGMTDFFMLLMLAGAGDQLQGIKRGIMEMADGILITKADGDNAGRAGHTCAEYTSALHLFPPTASGWVPKVLTASALAQHGIVESWQMVEQYTHWMKERNLFDDMRKQQDVQWFRENVREQVIEKFFADKTNRLRLDKLEEEVRKGNLSPFGFAL